MPTFFDTYQEYLKDPRSIELSKKKYKQLHQSIKFYYDRWDHREPMQYRKFSNEAGEPCEVRLYPEKFIPKMKSLIIRFCEEYKKNLAGNEAQQTKNETKHAEKIIPNPRKRTRKVIPHQPVFSIKKSP